MTKTCIVAACAILSVAGLAHAQSVRFVNASRPNGGNGLSWATAYNSLQAGLDAARAGGVSEIWVAAGSYTPRRGSPNRDESFFMVGGVAVLGGFVGNEATRDARDPALNVTTLSGDLSANDAAGFAGRGDNSRHVVQAQNLTGGSLDGFVIRGGNWDRPGSELGGGGGAYLFQSTFRVANCTFTDNIAGGTQPDLGGFGGALLLRGGNTTLEGCRFAANRGMNGGAMGISGFLQDRTTIDCFVTMTGCEFTQNFSPSQTGGAIWSATADPLEPGRGIKGEIRARRCTFTGNHAEYHGAWIEMNATVFEVDDCDFSGNFSVDYGGALSISQTVGIAFPALVRNSRFTGNGFAQQRGAGLFAQARQAVLDSCTFSGNLGTSIVHSQPVIGFAGGAKELELRNCVVRDNTGTGVFGFRNPSVIVTNCTILNNPSTISGGLAGGIETSAADVRVYNTILWGNRRGQVRDEDAQVRVFDTITQLSHSIVEGLRPEHAVDGNLGLDPMLAADGISPLPGSPAIDTASNELLPPDLLDLDNDGDRAERLPRDLVGNARSIEDALSADCRFFPGTCGESPLPDMGAVEFVPPPCPADFNDDGFVDFFDISAFVVCFEGDECPPGRTPDFNGDGFTDFFDSDAFVAAFESGC